MYFLKCTLACWSRKIVLFWLWGNYLRNPYCDKREVIARQGRVLVIQIGDDDARLVIHDLCD